MDADVINVSSGSTECYQSSMNDEVTQVTHENLARIEEGVKGEAHRKEKEPRYLRYLRYFDRIREGLPPAQVAEEEEVTAPEQVADLAREGALPDTPSALPGNAPTEGAVEEPASVALDSLATNLPDPDRAFWWFSSTPLPHLRISAGRPVEEKAGTRLPAEADYWAHEGAEKWEAVDRSAVPKPQPPKLAKRSKGRTLIVH